MFETLGPVRPGAQGDLGGRAGVGAKGEPWAPHGCPPSGALRALEALTALPALGALGARAVGALDRVPFGPSNFLN